VEDENLIQPGRAGPFIAAHHIRFLPSATMSLFFSCGGWVWAWPENMENPRQTHKASLGIKVILCIDIRSFSTIAISDSMALFPSEQGWQCGPSPALCELSPRWRG
jgi:hypothetical protein